MTERRSTGPSDGSLISATNYAMITADVLIIVGVMMGVLVHHLQGGRVHPYFIPGCIVGAGLLHTAVTMTAVFLSRQQFINHRATNHNLHKQSGFGGAPEEPQPIVHDDMVKGFK